MSKLTVQRIRIFPLANLGVFFLLVAISLLSCRPDTDAGNAVEKPKPVSKWVGQYKVEATYFFDGNTEYTTPRIYFVGDIPELFI